MKQPEITFYGGEHEDGDVFIVQTRASAGSVLGQHKHEHGHMSYLVSGIACVEALGVMTVHTAPMAITMPAGVQHTVMAVTDIIWLCLWDAKLGMQDAARESLKLVEA